MSKPDLRAKKQLPKPGSESQPSKKARTALILRSPVSSNFKFPNVYEHGYDPMVAEQSVRPDKLVLDPRFWRIANTLRALTVSHWPDTDDQAGDGGAQSERRRKRARQLTQTLVELGPTFIKLGQFLSVRRDFLPQELAEELGLLQDRVPAFPIEHVRETIRNELGSLPEDLFQSFEFEPIASASIGQVHRAILNDGRLVAIKIQRPDLARILYQDLGCMRWFAKFSNALSLKGDWESWLELSDEFGKTLFEEIDYIKEGRNADRLRHALRDRSEIVIPRVIWKYTGRRVIALEYLAGTKIDRVADLELAGFDRELIGRRLIECFMDQVLTHGFFHADPHAGNLAINSDGRIVLYDFGMMGEISGVQRDCLLGCIAAVVNKDTTELTKHLVSLGVIRKSANLAPIERALSPFIEYYSGRSVRDLDFTHLEKDIDEIAISRALRLPPTLAYLIRTGATLEGIARTLKPDFSFVDAAKPSLQKWVVNQPSQAAGIMRALYKRRATASQPVVNLKTKETKSRTATAADKVDHGSGSRNGKTSSDPASHLESIQAMVGNSPKSEEVDQIKTRIMKLEIELKRGADQVTYCVILVIIQLLMNGFFWHFLFLGLGASNNAGEANAFLIGNGLIGAIILWQLMAKPGRLLEPSRRTMSNGDKRC